MSLLRAFLGYAFLGFLAKSLGFPEPLVLVLFITSIVAGVMFCYKAHKSIKARIKKGEYW